MIEYIQSSEDVIALRITGKLTRDELEAITARVEKSLAENGKTHIFVEVEDYSGFELSALPDYLPRAMHMLGQRERFGRIAVVSDIAWVRWATRLESALLPGISYETYAMDEREQALAWVEGRSPFPHGQALTLIETDRPDAFGFELDGRIGAEEMHELVARIDELMTRRPGPVRVLGIFRHFSMPALAGIDGDYVRMKLEALHRVERYAFVGGPPWLSAWILAMAPLLKLEIRHFPADKEREAWRWLGASPKTTRRRAA